MAKKSRSPKRRKPTKAPRNAPGGAATSRAMAAAIGVSPGRVSQLAAEPGWPVNKRGPWPAADVEAVKAWHQARRRQAPGTPAGAAPTAGQANDDEGPDLAKAYAQVRVLLYRERTQHEKVKREILEGQLIRRDAVDGALGGLAAVFIAVLHDVELALPGRLAGLDAPAIEVELSRYMDAARRRIIESAEYETKSLAEATTAAQRRRGPGRPAAARPTP